MLPKRLLTALLLSFLILSGFFVSSVQAITVVIEPPTLLTIDGEPVTSAIPRTTNRTPTFIGQCNLPFADMDYEMHAPVILDSGKADSRGIWQWTVPQQLNYGLHTFYVTATDPNDSTNTETSVFQIEVVRSVAAIIGLGLPWVLGGTALAIAAFILWKRFKRDLERK